MRQLLLQFKKKIRYSCVNTQKPESKDSLNSIVDSLILYFKSLGTTINNEDFTCKKESNEYSTLYTFDDIKSMVPENQQVALEENIWRGSVASIIYTEIRCFAIHQGNPSGIRLGDLNCLTFDDLYTACVEIFGAIKNDYERTKIFCNNDGHPFSQPSLTKVLSS